MKYVIQTTWNFCVTLSSTSFHISKLTIAQHFERFIKMVYAKISIWLNERQFTYEYKNIFEVIIGITRWGKTILGFARISLELGWTFHCQTNFYCSLGYIGFVVKLLHKFFIFDSPSCWTINSINRLIFVQ